METEEEIEAAVGQGGQVVAPRRAVVEVADLIQTLIQHILQKSLFIIFANTLFVMEVVNLVLIAKTVMP